MDVVRSVKGKIRRIGKGELNRASMHERVSREGKVEDKASVRATMIRR